MKRGYADTKISAKTKQYTATCVLQNTARHYQTRHHVCCNTLHNIARHGNTCAGIHCTTWQHVCCNTLHNTATCVL